MAVDATRIATIHDNEEVREYYVSIRDPFEQTFLSMKASNPFQWLLTSIGVLLFFSVVPVLPWLLYFVIPRLMGANTVMVGRVYVPLHSFFLWYVATVLPLSACLWAANAYSTRQQEDRKKEWLAGPQLRFGYCYGTVDHIEKYRKNKLPLHIKTAQEYYGALLRSLPPLFNPGGGMVLHHLDEERYRAVLTAGYMQAGPGFIFTDSLFPQIQVLLRSSPWFRLETGAQRIIEALDQLPLKVSDRLKDKKDLHLVEEYLTDLAAYLYCTIPELSSGESGPDASLLSFGQQRLASFAEKLIGLQPYTSEPEPVTSKPSALRRLRPLFRGVWAVFSHRNPLLRFLAWWACTQAAVSAGVKLALRLWPRLTMDSAIIVMLIATPLLVAAASLAVPIRDR